MAKNTVAPFFTGHGVYRSIFNQCDVIGQQAIEFGEKTQNKGYYAVQGHSRSSRRRRGRYQSKARATSY